MVLVSPRQPDASVWSAVLRDATPVDARAPSVLLLGADAVVCAVGAGLCPKHAGGALSCGLLSLIHPDGMSWVLQSSDSSTRCVSVWSICESLWPCVSLAHAVNPANVRSRPVTVGGLDRGRGLRGAALPAVGRGGRAPLGVALRRAHGHGGLRGGQGASPRAPCLPSSRQSPACGARTASRGPRASTTRWWVCLPARSASTRARSWSCCCRTTAPGSTTSSGWPRATTAWSSCVVCVFSVRVSL